MESAGLLSLDITLIYINSMNDKTYFEKILLFEVALHNKYI